MNSSSHKSLNSDLSQVTTYQAGIVQSATHRILKKQVSHFLRVYGITMMEWFALGIIRDASSAGLRVSDIANTLQTTLPYTTKLLNTLEHKQWIERNDHADDNRVRLIRLAGSAETVCQTIEADLRTKLRDHIYKRVDPADFQAYIKVLYALSQA